MSEYLNFEQVTKIKVFGVGGGGCNAVNRMVDDEIRGVNFYIANTDLQVINQSSVENKIVIGTETTGGLGAGGNPEIGKRAALENEAQIRELVADTDMVIVTAGMGGGTGTGAAPVFAKIAKEAGCLTIGVVTKPFRIEGKKRMMQALDGIDQLRASVDSLIVIPNEKVKEAFGSAPLNDAFANADNVLKLVVRAITDLVSYQALINLDFADVKAVLSNQGTALIGVGQASTTIDEDGKQLTGKKVAEMAALQAISCPLLEASIKGARSAIINVTGSSTNLTLDDAEAAVDLITEATGEDLDIYLGVAINDNLDDRIIVTVIATGFEDREDKVEYIVDSRKSSAESSAIPSFFEDRKQK